MGLYLSTGPPLPKTCRFELFAVAKALEFAGSSMTCETAFTLGDLRGFSSTRPFEYMESCMPEVPTRLVRVAKICTVLLFTKLRRALPSVVLSILSSPLGGIHLLLVQ